MDTTLIPGSLSPVVFAVVVAGAWSLAYIIARARGGQKLDLPWQEAAPSSPPGPSAECKAACAAWQNRRLATCNAVREEQLAKDALDIAQKEETRAFILWLAALAALLAASIYRLPNWIIVAQLALAAASFYWGYCKGELAKAQAAWLDKRYATAEAIALDNQARAEVIRNCSPEDAQACLSMPPCDI